MNSVEKYNIIKWILYLGIIFSSFMLRRNITNNLKFAIKDTLWCPAFGNTARCDLAILTGSFGIFAGFGLLLMSVHSSINKNASFFLGAYNEKEPIFCLLQIPIWICAAKTFLSWTEDVMDPKKCDCTPGWEIWCVYVYIILNMLFLYWAAMLSYVQKNVRESNKD